MPLNFIVYAVNFLPA